MRLRLFFKHDSILVAFTAGAMLLLCGCTDARKVAELQARIEALEKRQEEDGIKLAGMSEKIVTKAIEVRHLNADIIELGEYERGFGHVTIDFSGITLSTINLQNKTGAEATLNSSSISIMDHASFDNSSAKDGNRINLSVKKRIASTGKTEGETDISIWSLDPEKDGKIWSRNLRKEAVSDSEHAYGIHETNSSFNIIGKPGGQFAIRNVLMSDDGVVRFDLANLSALPVATLRGTVEILDYKRIANKNLAKDKSASVSFVIDQQMEVGKWTPVAVPFDIKKKDILGHLVIKDLFPGTYYFSK
jgi:hypothetical protein